MPRVIAAISANALYNATSAAVVPRSLKARAFSGICRRGVEIVRMTGLLKFRP